ncbi:MAG: hypothetical protein ACRDTD_28285 [Pseudonocardiaceae bacterium]
MTQELNPQFAGDLGLHDAVEDHHNSPWVADPLRHLVWCLVSNGAIAIVLTSADRAANLPQVPVHVWASGRPTVRDCSPRTPIGSRESAEQSVAYVSQRHRGAPTEADCP